MCSGHVEVDSKGFHEGGRASGILALKLVKNARRLRMGKVIESTTQAVENTPLNKQFFVIIN
jgi:hypothetical protein